MKNIDKYVCAFCVGIFSSSAYAKVMPGGAVPIGIFILCFPVFFGLLISGKGNRWWFIKIAVLIYLVDFFIAKLAPSELTILVFLLFPYTLLPVSIYKRYKN